MRLFQTRRSSDTGQKANIKEAAAVIADIIVKHLEQKPFSMYHSQCTSVLTDNYTLGDKLSLFSYYTSMLNTTMALLVDGELESCHIECDCSC